MGGCCISRHLPTVEREELESTAETRTSHSYTTLHLSILSFRIPSWLSGYQQDLLIFAPACLMGYKLARSIFIQPVLCRCSIAEYPFGAIRCWFFDSSSLIPATNSRKVNRSAATGRKVHVAGENLCGHKPNQGKMSKKPTP